MPPPPLAIGSNVLTKSQVKESTISLALDLLPSTLISRQLKFLGHIWMHGEGCYHFTLYELSPPLPTGKDSQRDCIRPFLFLLLFECLLVKMTRG